MLADAYLRMLRRRLNDVDPQAERRGDEALLQLSEDSRIELAVRQVRDMGTFVVNWDSEDLVNYGFRLVIDNSTSITDDLGVLLLLYTTATILRAEYQSRLDRGDLGVSWRSGLEEESSIQAEKAYRDAVQAVEREFEEVLLIYNRRQAGTRPQ